jgi:hypothetical protein
MQFRQNKNDGSCDINFSDEEIEIIKKHKKIHINAISFKHFSNCFIRMVMEWQENFNGDIKNMATNAYDVVEGEEPKNDKSNK